MCDTGFKPGGFGGMSGHRDLHLCNASLDTVITQVAIGQ